MSIALTDTFGTPSFLEAFRFSTPEGISCISTSNISSQTAQNKLRESGREPKKQPSYAEVFNGVRQDSGDPEDFIKLMKDFYRSEGIVEGKIIVFSDALNTELCLKYKAAAEAAGFKPKFGVGTFLTSMYN